MPHPPRQSLRRFALPLVASLTLGLAALPALGPTPQAHAATARTFARANGGNNGQASSDAKPARHSVRPSAIHALVIPGSTAVVTDCSTFGYTSNSGTRIGLGTALATAAANTFQCNAGYGGFDVSSGHYIITVPQAISPAFAFPAGEVASIDGSDGGKNDVTIDGGAVYNPAAHTVVGGVQIFYVSDASGATPAASLALRNLTLAHGYASADPTDGFGGAVQAYGDFSATNCTFTGNLADFGGGALELDARGKAGATAMDTIAGSTFTSNVEDPKLNATKNFLIGGGAIDIGGAGMHNPQSVSIGTSAFTRNTDYASIQDVAYGGAILVDNSAPAQVAIATSTFAGNRAVGIGPSASGGYGGALVNNYGAVQISGSTFAGNSTPFGADGAIANYNDNTMAITNSTLVANKADGLPNGAIAGAIFNIGSLAVSFSTITDNGFLAPLAGTFGGGITNDGLLTLKANIIARNIAETGSDVYDSTGERVGVVHDQGYNLFSAPGTVVGFTPSTTPPDLFGNPNLATALAYNGGPTPTLRLLPFASSPAFTANAVDQVPAGVCTDTTGTPLTTDQRGPGFVRPFPFPAGNCDIGAYEASILTLGSPFGTPATSCSLAIGFFAPGGTQFALRTGSQANVLFSYLSIYGPGGRVRAIPQVPRAGVASTLTCSAPDPAAAPTGTTTIQVDALVVTSTNPSVARGSTIRIVATRTASTETVTVSAVNMGATTGATLYSLTPYVQPQTFVVALGQPALYIFPTT